MRQAMSVPITRQELVELAVSEARPILPDGTIDQRSLQGMDFRKATGMKARVRVRFASSTGAFRFLRTMGVSDSEIEQIASKRVHDPDKPRLVLQNSLEGRRLVEWQTVEVLPPIRCMTNGKR